MLGQPPVINKHTLLSLGTVILVGGIVFAFLLKNEQRMTAMESQISTYLVNNEKRLTTMESKISAYLIDNEKRITYIESLLQTHINDPNLHHSRFSKLEEVVGVKKSVSDDIQTQTKTLEQMSTNLQRLLDIFVK